MKFVLSPTEVQDMQGNTIDVVSTSSTTANASPIVLNKTNQIRFRFIPKLVNNRKNPEKAVEGKIVFERKRTKDELFPSDARESGLDNQCERITRGTVKVGDWAELSLDTSETYELYQGLSKLYHLYSDMDSIPSGGATFTRVKGRMKPLLSILQDSDFPMYMVADEDYCAVVKKLFELITDPFSYMALQKVISTIENEDLQHLTSSLNLEKLERMAAVMEENLDNSNEEFWQTTVFKENQWVLSQLFSCPCTIFNDKAYVGGKGLNNQGGNVCDFIFKNNLSQNVALIEIKTPCTSIFGKEYRATYSFSQELSGAINQILNYRDKLSKDYYHLCHESDEEFKVFTPKSVVVIGKLASMNDNQIAAFENFRNSLNNIVIVTFDELHQKIKDLISLLASPELEIAESHMEIDEDDDLPF